MFSLLDQRTATHCDVCACRPTAPACLTGCVFVCLCVCVCVCVCVAESNCGARQSARGIAVRSTVRPGRRALGLKLEKEQREREALWLPQTTVSSALSFSSSLSLSLSRRCGLIMRVCMKCGTGIVMIVIIIHCTQRWYTWPSMTSPVRAFSCAHVITLVLCTVSRPNPAGSVLLKLS